MRPTRLLCAATLVAAIILQPLNAVAQSPATFRFEAMDSIEQMQAHLVAAFRVGTPRDTVRQHFVTQGHAVLVRHPTRAGTEKYVYDIDLCRYYIWRWNISADYDAAGLLRQIYLNGEPALADGQSEPALDAAAARQPGTHVLRMARPRPEADRGESSLGFILMDVDGDTATMDDQRLIGAGPTRPHPADMGRLHAYNVAWWRSIFDSDAAPIVPYSRDCAAAEQAMERR